MNTFIFQSKSITGSPHFHNPSVQHISSTQKGHSFQPQLSASLTQKSLSSTHPSVQHQKRQFNTKNPSFRHTPQFNTPLSSTPPHFKTALSFELMGVLNWRMCRTVGFLVLNWGLMRVVLNWRVFGVKLRLFCVELTDFGAEKGWSFCVELMGVLNLGMCWTEGFWCWTEAFLCWTEGNPLIFMITIL